MDYSSYRKAFDAYSQLSDLQKQRFFPGREYEALCIGDALRKICYNSIDYYTALLVYITIYSRLLMGVTAERICITLQQRFFKSIPSEHFYELVAFTDLHRENIYFGLSNEKELEELKNRTTALHLGDSKKPEVHIGSCFAKKLFEMKAKDDTRSAKCADVLLTSLSEEKKHSEVVAFADQISETSTKVQNSNDSLFYHFDSNAEYFCAISSLEEWGIKRALHKEDYDQPLVLYKKAYSQYELGKHEEAIKTLESILQISPLSFHARYELAQNYFKLKYYNSALAVIKTAIRFVLLPRDVAACLRALGQVEIAKESYYRALLAYRYSCIFEKSPLAINEMTYIMSCDPHLRSPMDNSFFESTSIADVRQNGFLFSFSKPQRYAFEMMCAFSDLRPNSSEYKVFKDARSLYEKNAVLENTSARFIDTPRLIEFGDGSAQFNMNIQDLVIEVKEPAPNTLYVCPKCGRKVVSSVICPFCTYVFSGIEIDEASSHEENSFEAYSVFKKYTALLSDIVQQAPSFSHSKAESDIPSLVYVICDFAATKAKKNRLHIATEIEEAFLLNLTEQQKSSFYKRARFYGSIIRGKQLVGCCLPGTDISNNSWNECVKCAIAFCDCIVSPELLENYDRGPLRLNNPLELSGFFSSVVIPTMETLTELFKDVYNNVDT